MYRNKLCGFYGCSVCITLTWAHMNKMIEVVNRCKKNYLFVKYFVIICFFPNNSLIFPVNDTIVYLF